MVSPRRELQGTLHLRSLGPDLRITIFILAEESLTVPDILHVMI